MNQALGKQVFNEQFWRETDLLTKAVYLVLAYIHQIVSSLWYFITSKLCNQSDLAGQILPVEVQHSLEVVKV